MDTLGDLLDWWLDVRCSCGYSAVIPIKLMAQRHGAKARLPDLTPRLRCKQCGYRPPSDVKLLDRRNGAAPGSNYLPAKERPIL